MKKHLKKNLSPFFSFFLCILAIGNGNNCHSQEFISKDLHKSEIIENFDSGTIQLESYPGEDINPNSWSITSEKTYANTPFSLKLFGNTWKKQLIANLPIDSNEVWQVAAYINSLSEIQGFGIMDSVNSMFYSFAGTEGINFSNWLPVYQGCFSNNQWNIYQLPIADDWLAMYGYLPTITALVYVNDNDGATNGVVYFDEIKNISSDLPVSPQVTINYNIIGKENLNRNTKAITVQFSATIIDPDSYSHSYYWNFGDGTTSNLQSPTHVFICGDNHAYTVTLQVKDSTNHWGRASSKILLDSANSTFPLTMNFVGDIMLARNYESSGGIIQTQGVEAIFAPLRNYLKDSAQITIANLECPFTTHWEHHPTKQIYFKSAPANISGLTYAGIDIVSLANNHIMDYMLPGMQETQTVLNSNNILHSGAGANSYEAYQPLLYSKSGINFAFLASSDRTGQYNNYQPYLDAGFNKPGFANLTPYYIKKQIEDVRNISDYVIMEFHSGIEYSFSPNKSMMPEDDDDYSAYHTEPDLSNRSIRQNAINYGADLVICHHPHIIHGVEVYNGKLIAHSLGNFAFDLYYPETFPSMILNAQLAENGFNEFSIIPVYIDHYIPRRAKGELGLYILNDLAKKSKDLDTYLDVKMEQTVAKIILDTSLIEMTDTNFLSSIQLLEIGGNRISQPYLLNMPGRLSKISIAPLGDYQIRLGRELIWFGNMEDEGCKLWYLNNADESYCDTTAYKGLRSLQHIRKNSSPTNLVTNFENKIIIRNSNLQHTLCGYIKTKNAKNATIEIQYFNERTSTIPLAQENIGTLINGTTPWTYYQKELTMPAGTKFIDIRLNSGVPNFDTSWVWFDNIGVICWEEWVNTDSNLSINHPNDFYFMQFKTQQHTNNIFVNYAFVDFLRKDTSTIDIPDIKNVYQKRDCQNYPNPFNPAQGPTFFEFELKNSQQVQLKIYTIFGKLITILTDDYLQPGKHKLFWDGTMQNGEFVNSGIYIYQLEYDKKINSGKCVVIKN